MTPTVLQKAILSFIEKYRQSARKRNLCFYVLYGIITKRKYKFAWMNIEKTECVNIQIMGEIIIKRRKLTEQLEEHAQFILPLGITYFFGVIFVCVTYYTDKSIANSTTPVLSFLKLLFDSMIPTTITYVLGESVHSFISVRTKQQNYFIWSTLTFVFVVIYECIYLIYQLSSSALWVVILVVSTFLLLYLNWLSYREGYISTHRKHGLV